MMTRYWNPWREMETLRRQFDQVFDGLMTQNPIEPTSESFSWAPAVELNDTGDTLVLRAQLPGINANDLDIQVTREAVAIAGEHRHEQKTEENGFFKSEFRYGKFRRVVPLPVAIENEQVQAEYKDGILNLTLPKVTKAQNKVVKVNLGGQISGQAAAPAIAEGNAENN
ncbi:Hsp20/alpha crystallin family protein [Phormidium tenue FACHB-886]|nr:Hsp20/alpha crystallin family protein [Phormidium tenue FACHB-886]